MSRPPATIQIKRKATDDPVDVLRVHEINGKRQRRASEFVFTRQSRDPAHDGLPTMQTASQGPRPIKPLPRMTGGTLTSGLPSLAAPSGTTSSLTSSLSKQGDPNAPAINKNNNTSQYTPLHQNTSNTKPQGTLHRRFHISRTSTARARQKLIGGKVQKRAPTIFTERRIHAIKKEMSGTQPKTSASTTPEDPEGPVVSRSQKRPGRSARTTTSKKTSQESSTQPSPTTAEPAPKISLPSGLIMPWDVTSDKLAQELQAYTLQEIGRSIADSQHTHSIPQLQPNIVPRLKKPPSKFQPKKPEMRYHARHPEKAAAAAAAAAAASPMESDREETDDDGDYVIDTYIRTPADQVGEDPEADFGYIILESQPDIEEFYQEEMELSENEDYDEEDENAENHYSADYPDEEIESDDEYNRNAYHYRTRNASDDEEFDEDDYDMVDDDEEDAMRYPWRKRKLPAWMRKGAGMEVSDDEEGDEEDPNAAPKFATAADPNKKDPLADLFGGLTTNASKH